MEVDINSCHLNQIAQISYKETKAQIANNDIKIDYTLFVSVLCKMARSILKYVVSEFKYLFILSVIFLTIVLFVYVLYKSYWSPTLFKRELTELGFEHIPKGPDHDRRITLAQKARSSGTKIPPPYPNGWFAVAESRDLKNGGVISVDAIGQNLCVYRGEDGIARCVDAYCPHLGANLAIGGAVTGSCIECPFHKWRFDSNGTCVSVPDTEKAPKGVSIRSHPTTEVEGAVWVWYDAEGRPPLWTLVDHEDTKLWGYRGRNEYTISAHIQEIPENGADVAHLNAVHGASVLSTIGDKFPFLNDILGHHSWNATWSRNEDHTSLIELTHDYKIFKKTLCHIDVKIYQIGPGYVRLLLQTPLGPVLLSQSVTPLAPLLQKVVHRVFTPTFNAPLGALAPRIEGAMFERDVKIWNSKRFVAAPAYVRADKTIRAFRQWYSQFYSESSISFRDSMQNPLDW